MRISLCDRGTWKDGWQHKTLVDGQYVYEPVEILLYDLRISGYCGVVLFAAHKAEWFDRDGTTLRGGKLVPVVRPRNLLKSRDQLLLEISDGNP